MIVPVIHLNGTSQETLLEQVRNAGAAVGAALKALYAASPNGRDYYPLGPVAFRQAVQEHGARVEKLTTVHRELEELAYAISQI